MHTTPTLPTEHQRKVTGRDGKDAPRWRPPCRSDAALCVTSYDHRVVRHLQRLRVEWKVLVLTDHTEPG